jgi:cystathionine gamma-synthase
VSSLDRSTVWPHVGGKAGEFTYQRAAHPAGVEAERRLGELDGGTAVLFASGMGAATSLVLAFAKPGDTIALARDAYYGTSLLFEDLGRWGLGFVEYDQAGPPPDDAQLVWVEAPSNPLLTMPDLEAAAAHPAPLVVDATAATPVHLRPLEHGADFVLHSATKYMGGHHDLVAGAIVCRRPEDAERLLAFRTHTGIVAAPDVAWLLLRGLKTLEVRVQRQTETAGELARRLARHRAVEQVRYPGFGGLLSFDVAGGAEAAERVETSTTLIANATSLGGVDSVLETRARYEGDRVPPGLVRLSVGLEDVEELWADLARALDVA